ncbi:ATP-binding cassette domain-containing protein [Conexibacter sp. CPCC 206217]|uniref:ATP-binding cassette domain-containing protein n=1 Tax=Conexibacter sp. CPCC 206217 TaxID=3064574 RepID=UPI0027271163|nr:ATP-binding cassette domain-containing protein [Conexibacter sp. CPCC 206217]MDO8212266.1 ATP-binding cassette domain-containing protein [Conexibacter sp. CPCC 206217]
MSRTAAGAGLVARDLWLVRGEQRAATADDRGDRRHVLRGASIDVPRGAITALLAPSGAGKSTLLRCLNRLLEPDRGTILLDGADVRTLEPCALRRRVGLVAQEPVMLPGDVAANVGYGLDALPRERVQAALAAAGLDASFAPRRADALSGGERARVAIARAIAREPELLLLDEPTAALDGDAAEVVAATLVRLAREGLGICLATHDLALAERIADRSVGLDAA